MDNKRQVNVKSSPGNFEKVSSDLQYRESVAQEALAKGEYNEVIFTPNDPDCTMETEVTRDVFQATSCMPKEPLETQVTSDNSPATSCTCTFLLASPELELSPSAKKRRTALKEFMEKAEDRAKRREENDFRTRQKYDEFVLKREKRAQEKEERAKEKMELLRELVANTRK